MTRVIIKAVPDRGKYIKYLRSRIPEAEFCMDLYRDGWDTFYRSLVLAGDDACIHMEEDILITEDWRGKIEKAIAERPDTFIQFFSMRKADLTEGSRYDGDFIMNQCWYAPKGWSRKMAEYMLPQDPESSKWGYKVGTDRMVHFFLKECMGSKYWIHCPSLVEHRVGKSVIDPHRSSKRQSLTFTDPAK